MQAVNPFLPQWEYVPDRESYVFGDRIYLYGAHDRFGGEKYCLDDYVCWSAPCDDLSDWRCEGIIYKKTQDPTNPDDNHRLFAPDLQQGPNGKYYLYYALDFVGIMSVAVADRPEGPFSFYGYVHYQDGTPVGEKAGDIFQFDPGILVEGDRVFLCSGFAMPDQPGLSAVMRGRRNEGAYFMELLPDMLTVKEGPKLIAPKEGDDAGTSFEGHAFLKQVPCAESTEDIALSILL